MKRISPSKKRKLEYIRQKNNYRKGGKAQSIIKVPSEMNENIDLINDISKPTIERLNKKFNLNFEMITFESGLINSDFANDLKTVKTTFKVKKQ